MSRFARSIRIDASAAPVWAVLMDVDTWPVWAAQFKRLERLDGAPLALGSRVRVTPNGMPGSTWQVTEYVPERSFTWQTSLLPGARLAGGHLLTRDGDGVIAEFSLEATGPLGRLLSPLLRRTVFSRNTRNATEGLKRHVEAAARG